MKLSQSRSCVLRSKPLQASPKSPKSRKMSKVSRRIPRTPLQIINLQRRRYHSTLEVKIDDCITVGDLKNTIAVQQNLSVIAVLFHGVPLDDTRLLENLLPDHRVGPPRFAVHTRVRPRAISGGVIINVQTLARKTLQVPLHSLDGTLCELKEAIKAYEGISMEQIALTHQGKQIANEDHCTLRACKLEPGCTVHLVGRLRGGWKPFLERVNMKLEPNLEIEPMQEQPVEFVDMENMSLLQKKRLNSKLAPVWRTLETGLNVEGECCNEYCDAFGQMVIRPLNFTVFNVKEEVHCPMCEVAIRARTCSFRSCLWMFEGRKVGAGNIDFASGWMVAGSYEVFNEVAKGAKADWSSLIITAKKLPNLKAFHGAGQCPICTEEFNSLAAAVVNSDSMKCKHAFHQECVIGWQMRGNTTCPSCRDSFE